MRKDIVIYKNSDVNRIIAFIPPGHKHTRLLIETIDKILIFQEATISAIIRAYVNVALHPKNKAFELIRVELKDRKEGYARFQQIESYKDEGKIITEVTKLLDDLNNNA